MKSPPIVKESSYMKKRFCNLFVFIFLIQSIFCQNTDFSVNVIIRNFTNDTFSLFVKNESNGLEERFRKGIYEITGNEMLSINASSVLQKGKLYSFIAKRDSSNQFVFPTVKIPSSWDGDVFNIEWHLYNGKSEIPAIEKITYSKKLDSTIKQETVRYMKDLTVLPDMALNSIIDLQFNTFINNDLSVESINVFDKNDKNMHALVYGNIKSGDKSFFSIDLSNSKLMPNETYYIRTKGFRTPLGESISISDIVIHISPDYTLEPVDPKTIKISEINKKLIISWEKPLLSNKDILYYKNDSDEWEQPLYFSRINPTSDGKYEYTSQNPWAPDNKIFKIVSEDSNGNKVETKDIFWLDCNNIKVKRDIKADVVRIFIDDKKSLKDFEQYDIKLFIIDGKNEYKLNSKNFYTYTKDSRFAKAESSAKILLFAKTNNPNVVINSTQQQIRFNYASKIEYQKYEENLEYKKALEKRIERKIRISDFFEPYYGWYSLEAGIHYDYNKYNGIMNINFPDSFEPEKPRFGFRFSPLNLFTSNNDTIDFSSSLFSVDYSFSQTEVETDKLYFHTLQVMFMLGFSINKRISFMTGVTPVFQWENITTPTLTGTSFKTGLGIPVDITLYIRKWLSVFGEYEYIWFPETALEHQNSFKAGLKFNTCF